MSDFLTQKIPTITGMLGAIAVRTAMSKAYESRRGTEPPVDPGAEESGWRQAITWTAIMAAGAGVGRLLGRYLVAETLEKQASGQRNLQKA